MGNVTSRENMGDSEGACGIAEFEHTFPASLEDYSPGIIPKPLPGYVPSTGPPGGRRVVGSLSGPLTGRLVMVHMLATEFVLRETVGLEDQTLIGIPYAGIRRLTWDHSRSGLKVGHGPPMPEVEDVPSDATDDPDNVFVTIRVENSLELEEELKERGNEEVRRAAVAGLGRPTLPAAVYLGMFAGYTKPKPFQRKLPNLSATVPPGHLPSLQEMRRWSIEEHWGIARPQIHSDRPRLALDAVFMGENRFSLLSATGLSCLVPEWQATGPSQRGELIFSFAGVHIELPEDYGQTIGFAHNVIDDWSILDMTATSPQEPSGFELWVLEASRLSGTGESKSDPADMRLSVGLNSRAPDRRRVFLQLVDKELAVAKNCMEFFWNLNRAKRQLRPKAGSTHGRAVASVTTLRGEMKAPMLPTGRLDPVNLDGVEVRVGQTVYPTKRTGKIQIFPSPRALLGVEKSTSLRYNPFAKAHWHDIVLHQGWLRKRGGGAVKRWVWRYFVLYKTPQGHFLAYYNDVSEIPLFSDARQERQLVDMSRVCFLRPEIRQPKHTTTILPPNAFTVVATDRPWTFCAESQSGVLQWLRMLAVATDLDVAVVDDAQMMFNLKAYVAPSVGRYGPVQAATAHIGSMGMELRFDQVEHTPLVGRLPTSPRWEDAESTFESTHPGSISLRFWAFTDFYKWSVVKLQDGSTALTIQCFSDGEFMQQENVLLATPKSQQLALAIEHQVEKFMSIMHLRVECLEEMEEATRRSSLNSADITRRDGSNNESKKSVTAGSDEDEVEFSTDFKRIPSMNMETNVGEWDGNGITIPGAPGHPVSPGTRGTFESSSSDDDNEDDDEVNLWAEHEESDKAEPFRQGASSSRNPFESHGNSDKNDKERGLPEAKGKEIVLTRTPETVPTTPLLSSGRLLKFFPDSASRSNAQSAAREDADRLLGAGATSDARDVANNSPLGSKTDTPRGVIPSSPPLSATWPILNTPRTANWQPELTSRLPSVRTPDANRTTDRGVGVARESSLKAFPATPSGQDSAGHQMREAGDLVRRTSSLRLSARIAGDYSQKGSIPFARPSGEVIRPFPAGHPNPMESDKVVHDGDSVRVVLDGIARKGSSCVVSVRHEVKRSLGATFSVAALTGEEHPAVLVSFKPEITSARLDGITGTRATFRQEILVTCTRPFVASPQLTLRRSAPNHHPSPTRRSSAEIMTVALPVTVVSFVSAHHMTPEAFHLNWKNITAQDQVAKAILNEELAGAAEGKSGNSTASSAIDPAYVRRILTGVLGLMEVRITEQRVVNGVERIAAAGALRTARILGGHDGASVGCLVGVESEISSGRTKITAKSASPVLANGLVNAVVDGIRRGVRST